MFELDQQNEKAQGAKIKLIGVGGGGGNAVNTMIKAGLSGVEFMIANTDVQALEANLAEKKIPIGQEITKGLGAGANPEVGRRAALEDYHRIAEELEGADMVFITAGMGGGTGTGAAPVIAKVAKELGALTVGVVTKPFNFEGKKRRRQAVDGIRLLKEGVDSLITIPNNRLLNLAGNHLSLVDTFKKADEVLLNAVQGISDLINHTGLINSDFADVRTIMSNKGLALMGTGQGEGEHRAVEAATNAISSPLLEDVSIDGATGLIINITGGSDLTTHEVNEATTLIMEAAHEDAEIIFGTVIDEELNSQIKVTVIATGIEQNQEGLNAPGTQAENLRPAGTSQPATATIMASTSVETITVSPRLPESAPPLPDRVQSSQQIDSSADSTGPAASSNSGTNPAQSATESSPPPQPAQASDTQPAESKPVQSVDFDAIVEEELMHEDLPRPRAGVKNDTVMPGFGGSSPVAERIKRDPNQPELFESANPSSSGSTGQREERSTTGSGATTSEHHESGLSDKPRSLASDLARAQEIARSLGVTNLSDDEYDIPTFIRRQQDKNEPFDN